MNPSLTRFYINFHYELCLTRLWHQALKDQCTCPSEWIETIAAEAAELKHALSQIGALN